MRAGRGFPLSTRFLGPVHPSPATISGAGGIASEEAFGTPTLTAGAVTISPSGIPSAEAFGTLVLSSANQIAPAGIASAEAFGTPVLTAGAVTISPSSIPSGEAFGTPALLAGAVTISPSSIPSGEAFGTPVLTAGVVTISPSSIPSGEAFGIPHVFIVGEFVPVVRIPPSVGKLEWEITTLHYPDQDAVVLAHLVDVADGLVTIPRNDQRTAQVALSVYDPALGLVLKRWQRFLTALAIPGVRVRAIEAYAMQLRARYRGHPVFWGPITLPEWRGADGKLTLHAVDPTLRLQFRQLVDGDLAGQITGNQGHGDVEVSTAGFRMLRDSAMNTDDQVARGVPNVGIIDGIDGGSLTDPPNTLRFSRGDDIWPDWQSLSGSDFCVDFEIEPVFDIPGAYAKLNTYARQGEDKTDQVTMHFGFGADNLADYVWTPGGKIVTHVHALPSDLSRIVDNADLASSRLRGVYCQWKAAGYNADHDALAAYASKQVKQYGVPPDYVTVTLRPDTQADGEPALRYPEDIGPGDTVAAIAKRGYMHERVIADINEIRLRQTDSTGVVTPEIDLLPVINGEELSDETT